MRAQQEKQTHGRRESITAVYWVQRSIKKGRIETITQRWLDVQKNQKHPSGSKNLHEALSITKFRACSSELAGHGQLIKGLGK